MNPQFEVYDERTHMTEAHLIHRAKARLARGEPLQLKAKAVIPVDPELYPWVVTGTGTMKWVERKEYIALLRQFEQQYPATNEVKKPYNRSKHITGKYKVKEIA